MIDEYFDGCQKKKVKTFDNPTWGDDEIEAKYTWPEIPFQVLH